MATAYVLLAEGFEEIEAITPIDLLRRAGVTVVTVGLTSLQVTGAHQIQIQADITAQAFEFAPTAAMVVLPGGSPGAENLMNDPRVIEMLQQASQKEMWIGAICAAPLVLQKAGLLKGKRVTAYPGVQPQLTQCKAVTGQGVEQDGLFITGRSAGVAIEFSHCLIKALCGVEVADQVVEKIYPHTSME